MVIALHAVLDELHVVMVPPLGELAAPRAQKIDQLVEPAVFHIAGVRRPELLHAGNANGMVVPHPVCGRKIPRLLDPLLEHPREPAVGRGLALPLPGRDCQRGRNESAGVTGQAPPSAR